MTIAFPFFASLSTDNRRSLLAIIAGLLGAAGIALLHIETVLAIALFTAGLYAGVKRPDIGLALIACSVPVQRSLLVGIGDTAVTTTKVLLWSTVAGCLWASAVNRNRIRLDKVTLGLAIVTACLALSGWNARDGGLWIGETYRWLAGVPIACMAFNVFRRGWSPVPFLLTTAGGAIGSYGLATWQLLRSVGPDSFESRGLMRASGSFGHPNQLAIYFELTTPLMVALAIYLWKQRPESALGRQLLSLRWVWFVAAGAGIAGLFFTQSRGGGVGMAAALATILLLGWPLLHLRSHVLMAISGAAMILGSVALIVVIASGSMTTDQRGVNVDTGNFAVEERIAHWTAGVEMARAHPFLGVGAGNYDLNFREETTTWRFRIGRGHAHNSYIQMLAQGGVITFAGYALLIALIGLTIAQALDRAKTLATRALTVGVAGMSAGMLMHAVFEYVHVLSLNLQMAIAWGLASAIVAGGVDRLGGERG